MSTGTRKGVTGTSPHPPGSRPAEFDAVPIQIVVALPVEAAPIVEAWMLERRSGDAFAWFEGELPGSRNPIRLTISGVGRARCAAAVGWSVGDDPQLAARSVWVNFGIAGAERFEDPRLGDGLASRAEVGDVVLASAVRDTSRARLIASLRDAAVEPARWRGSDRVPCWYPPWLGRRPPSELVPARGPRLVRSTVHTVDLPEVVFGEPGAYEMEAAAFVQSALPQASTEFVQVVKVVSDTPRTGLSVIDRKAVEKVSVAAVPLLGRLVQEFVQWRAISVSLDAEAAAWSEQWTERLRLSVSQRRQFARLVQRAVALTESLEAGSSGTVLERLEATLSRLEGDRGERRVRADGKRVLSQFTRWVDELAIGRHEASQTAEPGSGNAGAQATPLTEGES